MAEIMNCSELIGASFPPARSGVCKKCTFRAGCASRVDRHPPAAEKSISKVHLRSQCCVSLSQAPSTSKSLLSLCKGEMGHLSCYKVETVHGEKGLTLQPLVLGLQEAL